MIRFLKSFQSRFEKKLFDQIETLRCILFISSLDNFSAGPNYWPALFKAALTLPLVSN